MADLAGSSSLARPTPPWPVTVRHLVWLKWTLLWRGLSRDRHRLIGAIVLLVVVLPVALAEGVLTFAAYRGLPRPVATEVLFLVLTILFAAWLVVPLVLYNLNESLDVSRLFLYPVSGPRLMAGLLVTSLLDLPAIFALALMGAVVAGWARSPLAVLLVSLALLALYGQMVAASQALLALFNAALRSRRFRDVTLLILALFGATFFLWQQVALNQLGERGFSPRQVLRWQVSPWLQWTPPGTVARVVEAANAENWLVALAWLALALASLILLTTLWHRALRHLMTNAETGSGPARSAAAEVRRAWSWPGLPLPRPVLALARKDLRYFWRDPQLKAMILNVALALVILLIAPWLGLRRGPDATQAAWLVLALPLPVAMTTLTLSINAFGIEQGGLRVLFLLPVQATTILIGKNLAVALLAGLEAVIVGVGLAAFGNGWATLPAGLVAALAAVLVTLAAGNIVSVLLPGRMPEGTRPTHGAEVGCARGLLQFGAFLAVWLALLPVGAATAGPALLGQPALAVLTLPAALAYGGGIYALALRRIGPVLQARQPEILNITTRD